MVLKLLADVDMHLFMEKGMWGGISMVSKCFARPNNPSFPGSDSPTHTSSTKMWMTLHLEYVSMPAHAHGRVWRREVQETFNLYSWSMSHYLQRVCLAWKWSKRRSVSIPGECRNISHRWVWHGSGPRDVQSLPGECCKICPWVGLAWNGPRDLWGWLQCYLFQNKK